MTHRKHLVVLMAALGGALLFAVSVDAQEPEWRLIRPSNTGVPGDYCHTIFVDQNDRPWIAGYVTFWEEGGLGHFDGNTWITISNADYPTILSPRFNDIVKAGGMWIGTDLGLLRFDPAAGPSSLIRYDTTNSPMLGNQVKDVDVAPDGTIWLALDTVGGTVAGGLAQYDPAAGTWNTWDTSNGLPWGKAWPGWDWVDHVAVVPDPVGNSYTVWIDGPLGVATYHDGTFAWFDPYNPPPGERYPTGIQSNDPVDEQGNIWMIVDPGVMGRLSQGGSWTVTGYPAGLSTEVSRVYAMSGGRAILTTYYGDVFRWDGQWFYLGNWGNYNHTYAFAEESGGAFWVGGIGGAARYEAGTWQRYRVTNTGMIGFFINAIEFGADGDVYMNGNAAPGVGGFDILHADGTWTNANDATYGLGLPWGLPTDDVEDLAVRANGNVALALAGIQGVVEWNGTAYTYLTPQGYDFIGITEDGLGRLWAARYGGYGIFRITGPQQYTQYTSGNSPLPAGSISDIVPDPANPGFVWIAAQFGLAHTDGDTWDVYPRELLGLTQNSLGYHITCADLVADGTLWVGSGVGLFHFDPATTQYTRYDLSNTPLPSDDFWNVEIAPDGTVWVSTFDHVYPYPGGLSHFDGKVWTTYSAGSSPLPHNQINVLRSRSVPGGYELWVGTASEAIAVLTLAGTAVPGDFDGDGDVDLDDFGVFAACYGGANNPPAPSCPPGADADLDGDGDVDLDDFSIFAQNFTGAL